MRYVHASHQLVVVLYRKLLKKKSKKKKLSKIVLGDLLSNTRVVSFRLTYFQNSKISMSN